MLTKKEGEKDRDSLYDWQNTLTISQNIPKSLVFKLLDFFHILLHYRRIVKLIT
jgi:hypothetical protein